MISEVLFKEMLNENYSRRTIDLVILSTVNSDWDGNVHLTPSKIAKVCNSKTRYVNKLINKLQKYLGTKAPIKRVCDKAVSSSALKLHYGQIDKYLPYSPSNRYMKVFNLFFDNDFIEADVVTKRLILVACYEYSVKKFPVTHLDLRKLKKKYYSLQNITKQQVHTTIRHISTSNLKKYFTVSETEGSQVLAFSFNDFVQDDFVENTTIFNVIRDTAIESGYHFELTDAVCEGISKQMSYIRNSLYDTFKRDTQLQHLKYDDIKAVTQSFIKDSLLGMFKSLSSNFNTAQEILGLGLSSTELFNRNEKDAIEITNGNKAAAYFFGVFKSLLQEESAKAAYKIAQLDSLYSKSSPVLSSFKKQDVFVKQFNSLNNKLETNSEALSRTSNETYNEIYERTNVLQDMLRLFSSTLLSMSQNDTSSLEESYSKELAKMSNPKSIETLKGNTLKRANIILQNLKDIKTNTIKILKNSLNFVKVKHTYNNLITHACSILEDFYCRPEQKIVRFCNELS